jgi:predicted nucleic acid-binding protein
MTTVTAFLVRRGKLTSEHQLSVCDAAYLELAQRRRLPLGCKDGPLRKAALRCGVRVVE